MKEATINIRIPASQWAQVRAIAEAQQRSATVQLSILLREGIASHDVVAQRDKLRTALESHEIAEAISAAVVKQSLPTAAPSPTER